VAAQKTQGVYPIVSRHAESAPDLGIDPSTLPIPSHPIIHDQRSGSTQTTLSRMFIISDVHLITFRSYNIGRRTISDRIPSVIRTGRSQSLKSQKRTVDPGVDENKSDWKSTAHATTKLAIQMVRESSDPGPLSSPWQEVSSPS